MSEKAVLKLCIWLSVAFAVAGIVWGTLINSAMIRFDGIYSLISCGLSGLSLVVLNQVKSPKEDDRFPFGKAHFEPLFILFKSLAIIGICLYAAADSFADLLDGGRRVAPGPALIYAGASTLACLAMTLYLRHKNKTADSGILQAEQHQWTGDFLLSLGVLVGFCAALFLEQTPLDWIVPYADPGMVVAVSGLFILLPLKSLIKATGEILYLKTESRLMDRLEQEAQTIAADLNAEHKIRMHTMGRELIIEVNFLLDHSIQTLGVDKMDRLRNQLAAIVQNGRKSHWINISFTRERQWL